MAKQDSYARVSIRIPPELYGKLQEAAGDKSLNAEIIARLESTFPAEEQTDEEIIEAAKRLVQRLEARDAERQRERMARKKPD